MTSGRGKVVYMGVSKERAERLIGMAPPDLDVRWVDINLPDDEKLAVCRDADALIIAPADISTSFLANCPGVKLIQTLSAGYDRLDVGGILEMGIPIANNGGANAIAVSEQAIALMIAVSKKTMLQWYTTTKERRWREGLAGLNQVEISNKTVGIVGLGRIGKQVAKRLKGFDTRTLYYDIVEAPEEVREELNATPMPLDDLLRESDIVTLHVPLTPRTRAMIGERELNLMKPTAFLINTCRGPVVDEGAAYRALKNRTIAAAGLDVLEQEPTPSDNPLFDLDNVVVTPHMAGSTQEANIRAADFAYYNIRRVLAGETPESLVTPEY